MNNYQVLRSRTQTERTEESRPCVAMVTEGVVAQDEAADLEPASHRHCQGRRARRARCADNVPR